MGAQHSTDQEFTHFHGKSWEDVLRECVLFHRVTPNVIKELLPFCKEVEYRPGDVLCTQGEKTRKMFLILEGRVERTLEEEGKNMQVNTELFGRGINSLHILQQDPVYATAMCMSRVKVLELDSEDLRTCYFSSPILSHQMMCGLANKVRQQNEQLRSALFFVRGQEYLITATSLAAAMESFYRSAVNSMLTALLVGKPQPLFTSMHIQVPTRVLYINGFKGVRRYIEGAVDPSVTPYPNLTRMLMAFTPGILMSPLSGVLEALNCSTNPEPLPRRVWRGQSFRCVREIIFGLGLNQMSDFFEERMPFSEKAPRMLAGSLAAGVVSGYFSHIPHNLSTLKLGSPSVSYRKHFDTLAEGSMSRLGPGIGEQWRKPAAVALTLAMPKGLQIRTTQIVGSFVLINGIIHGVKTHFPNLP